ncbi:uncharacterized protein [Lolium perenne]|uniref:uncharacterized protein n=1 Tax=Lolium perenne TaxID=4522 RepID=UPI0021F56D71|nr:uncharacterized protein LOC127304175 [Lolium perenne]
MAASKAFFSGWSSACRLCCRSIVDDDVRIPNHSSSPLCLTADGAGARRIRPIIPRRAGRPYAARRALAELEAEKAHREKAEALLTQNQQQMAMQQQMMLWMTRKLSAHDAHLSASMPSGTTLPTDPPPFDINTWLHASGGSNNIELHGPSTQDGNDNLMTPPTGGQPSFNNLGIVRRL